MEILLAVAIVALTALTSSVIWAVRVFRINFSSREPVLDPVKIAEFTGMWEIRLDGLGEEIDRIKIALSDGIARNDRAEKRIQKTVASARRQLREAGIEHAGIEAEHAELLERDESPGEDEQLRLLPESVEPPRRSGIPGLSAEALEEIKAKWA